MVKTKLDRDNANGVLKFAYIPTQQGNLGIIAPALSSVITTAFVVQLSLGNSSLPKQAFKYMYCKITADKSN